MIIQLNGHTQSLAIALPHPLQFSQFGFFSIFLAFSTPFFLLVTGGVFIVIAMHSFINSKYDWVLKIIKKIVHFTFTKLHKNVGAHKGSLQMFLIFKTIDNRPIKIENIFEVRSIFLSSNLLGFASIFVEISAYPLDSKKKILH